MAEYIEREALLAEYDRVHIGEPGRARKLIEDALAEDVAPVVHGRWVKYYNSFFGQHQCFCSNCEESEYWKRYYCYGVENYCPNCGAKMDLEE